MKPNDQFLLEEAYSKILNEMHDIDDIADAVQSGDIHSDENVEISDEHKIYAKYSHFHHKNMCRLLLNLKSKVDSLLDWLVDLSHGIVQ